MYPLYSQAQMQAVIDALLAGKWVAFDSAMRSQLPTEGGIYRICDFSAAEPRLLYVGLSGNLRDRLYSKHFMGTPQTSTLKRKLVGSRFADAAAVKEYLRSCCRAQYAVVTESRLRCFAEHYAIATLQPPHND